MKKVNVEKKAEELLAKGILYEHLSDVQPEFTEQDDRNMLGRLQAVERRKQRKKVVRGVFRTGIAAAFLLLFITVSFPEQVQAIANRIYEMVRVVYPTHTDLHWESTTLESEDDTLHPFTFGYFPEELELVAIEGNAAGLFMIYSSKDDLYLYLTQLTSNTGISVDSEGAVIVEYGVDGVLFVVYKKRGETQIIWETYGNVFHIDSNIEPEVVRKIANEIIIIEESE